MTTAMVTQMSPYKDSVSPTPSGGGNAVNDFSKVFEKSASADYNKTDDTVKSEPKSQNDSVKATDEPEQTSRPEKATDTQDTEVNTEEKVTEDDVVADKTNVTDEGDNTLDEAAMEEVMEKAEEMMLAIQNVLNVSAEQLQDALQKLDMQPEDLLNPDMISKVVMELQGADEFALMTDESLFTDVKTLMSEAMTKLQELSKELGMTPQDMKQMLEQMKAPVEETPLSTALHEEQATEPVLPTQSENTAAVEVKSDKNFAGQKENSSKQQNGNEFNFSQSVMEQLKNAVDKTQNLNPISYTSTTQSVMDQINEMIKVTMKEDVTEMELTLHPASLGNVRVQVASREGVITASFTTQNETVKAALESQLIVLKENLNEQGIKVEAVEVTVSSHAFERNLNEEGEHSSNETQTKKKSARKITLSDISGEMEEGELTQEDEIVADMMRKNGNSVDYTA